MYNIQIQVEAEGPLFPKELKKPELAELAVEDTKYNLYSPSP